MLEKNQRYIAEITDITSEGHGVCRIDGMAVFVPMTAVGDVIKCKIVKSLKSFAYGIAEEIVTPSGDRAENFCPVYRQCGGCDFRHISYEAECRTKELILRNAFKRIGGLEPVFDEFIFADKISHYRNKAQYPLSNSDGKIVCGFFAPRSHRIVPVDNCDLQPKVFGEILKTVLEYLNEKKFSIYSEESNTGILRHIYLRRGVHSEEIMLCIVVRRDISRQLAALGKIVAEKFPEVKSFVLNINPDKTNVILGKRCVTLLGRDTINDVMCGNVIEISPLSFYQVNTVQAEKLYAKALDYASPTKNDVVVDLYCGAGTIGLSMAENVKKVIGVEIVPEAIENAKRNALRNNINNAEFYCGDAGKIFAALYESGYTPDTIIVDPPRKGCSEETLHLIAEAAPQKVIMISCNPATAARDVKYLSENGYSAEKVCGVDLFPKTKHVETVVLMSRKEK
ncbi:MAG TPA: 23S rRNA (uracil(1939)-C(5))-methyltransferase RlmD [Ruminococcus sp.]